MCPRSTRKFSSSYSESSVISRMSVSRCSLASSSSCMSSACRQSRARVHIRTVEILVNKSPANESSVVPDLDPPDCLGQRFDGWLPSRLIPHRHRPRAELQPAYELQVDTPR